MSSTSNKNTIGNYNMEQFSMKQNIDYSNYIGYGTILEPNLAGDGLLAGRMSREKMSKNSLDIESFLFGIGSSNLVNAYQPPVISKITIKSLSIIDKSPTILPEPFTIDNNQRPKILN